MKLIILTLFIFSFSFPVVRASMAGLLEMSSEALYASVDKEEFNFDYWFEKLNK